MAETIHAERRHGNAGDGSPRRFVKVPRRRREPRRSGWEATVAAGLAGGARIGAEDDSAAGMEREPRVRCASHGIIWRSSPPPDSSCRGTPPASRPPPSKVEGFAFEGVTYWRRSSFSLPPGGVCGGHPRNPQGGGPTASLLPCEPEPLQRARFLFGARAALRAGFAVLRLARTVAALSRRPCASTTTAYALRAGLSYPNATSRATASGSRGSGFSSPPPPDVRTPSASPFWSG
jgi:hypothetical protein